VPSAHHQAMHLLVFLHELISVILIFGIVTGGDNVFRIRRQNFQQRRLIIVLNRRDQCLTGFRCGRKCLLPSLRPGRFLGRDRVRETQIFCALDCPAAALEKSPRAASVAMANR